MSTINSLLKNIYINRRMAFAMAIQEMHRRYAGTAGGFVWSVVHPLMTILVFWVVFSLILRVQTQGSVPFIVVFCCGMIPWITFSEAAVTGSSAIIRNSHLITKSVFPSEIFPAIYLIASLVTHIIMVGILIIIISLSGISLSLWNFQFLYYLFALLIFSLGLGWFVSSINVFFRDTEQILQVIINIWFWLTPIVWEPGLLPERIRPLVKLNPVYYIVEGYRASFINFQPFWHNPLYGIYFWVVCISLFITGGYVFSKLKPEFAEML